MFSWLDSLFLLHTERYSIFCPNFHSPTTEGHFGCFPILAVMNEAIINICCLALLINILYSTNYKRVLCFIYESIANDSVLAVKLASGMLIHVHTSSHPVHFRKLVCLFVYIVAVGYGFVL